MCTNYICTMEFTFIRNTPPLSRKLCIKSLKQSFSFAWMIFLNKCTPYNFIIHWDTLFKNYVEGSNGIFSNTITIVYSITISHDTFADISMVHIFKLPCKQSPICNKIAIETNVLHKYSQYSNQ